MITDELKQRADRLITTLRYGASHSAVDPWDATWTWTPGEAADVLEVFVKMLYEAGAENNKLREENERLRLANGA